MKSIGSISARVAGGGHNFKEIWDNKGCRWICSKCGADALTDRILCQGAGTYKNKPRPPQARSGAGRIWKP